MIQGVDQHNILNFESDIKYKDWHRGKSVSADYSFASKDALKTLFVTTGSSTIYVVLPKASECTDRVIEIFKIDDGTGSITLQSNDMIIDSNSDETINGRVEIIDIIAQYHGLRVKCDGSNWYILDWLKPYERQYLGGNSYHGIPLTVSYTVISSVVRSCFIPYQLINGVWRLRFNMNFTVSAAAQSYTVTVAGITTPNISNYYQGVYSSRVVQGATVYTAYIGVNTNIFNCYHDGTSGDDCLWGDIELASKPTWAD